MGFSKETLEQVSNIAELREVGVKFSEHGGFPHVSYEDYTFDEERNKNDSDIIPTAYHGNAKVDAKGGNDIIFASYGRNMQSSNLITGDGFDIFHVIDNLQGDKRILYSVDDFTAGEDIVQIDLNTENAAKFPDEIPDVKAFLADYGVEITNIPEDQLNALPIDFIRRDGRMLVQLG
jgi:hypothetical protein